VSSEGASGMKQLNASFSTTPLTLYFNSYTLKDAQFTIKPPQNTITITPTAP
jgi:hypothetical protein